MRFFVCPVYAKKSSVSTLFSIFLSFTSNEYNLPSLPSYSSNEGDVNKIPVAKSRKLTPGEGRLILLLRFLVDHFGLAPSRQTKLLSNLLYTGNE